MAAHPPGPASQGVPGGRPPGPASRGVPGGRPPGRTLRSNFDAGTSRWATRRAQWLALGLTDADMAKPKIAIVNSSSALAICFSHLDEIAKRAKRAVERAGGVAFEVRTAAPSDFITSAGHRGGYILSARDLITNDIEVAVEGALLDGMLCLASCDKTAPGQLMAAARLDIPTIIVACGYQPSGSYRGRHCDIEDVFLAAGHVANGKLEPAELTGMSQNAILGPGVCPGVGTANTMHMACEALGMALPGTTPVRANSERMWDAVEQASARIVAMVGEDLRPRAVLTPEAFANAVITVLSVSGSINSVKHLQAVAAEAECDVDVYRLFERLADGVPLLTEIRPNGERPIEDLEDAGGARAVMKQLEGMLRTGALTVTGGTVGQNLDGVTVADEEVIRPASRPLGTRPAIVLIRGSLAPGGGIVKLAVADDRSLEFAGPAAVYDSPPAALEAVRGGEVRPGDVVVLRGQGPTGSPGMGMASQLVFALDGAGLTGQVAVVTDGQLSGLVNKGIVVGEVSPEAAAGGPLALLRTGDRIRIDVLARVADLDVPEDELSRRRAALTAPWPTPGDPEKGWLSIYQRLVRPLPEGAVLTPRQRAAPPTGLRSEGACDRATREGGGSSGPEAKENTEAKNEYSLESDRDVSGLRAGGGGARRDVQHRGR
jgi:dihydroxy-acid dehydratase